MKHFILRISVFIILFVLICMVIHEFALHERLHPNNDVYKAIARSKQVKPKVTQVVLGDCMSEQLFRHKDGSDSIMCLSSMAGIDLIGQFLLTKNFVEKNTRVKDVFLIINPFDFSHNLNHRFTYNYFLKPFYRKEYLEDFTPTAKKQIDKVPFSKFTNIPPISISFWTPDYRPPQPDSVFLSVISREYIRKLISLSKEHDFNLHILSAPLCDSDKDKVATAYSIFQEEGYHAKLFDNYFNHIVFLPDSIFMDPHHYFISEIPKVGKLYNTNLADPDKLPATPITKLRTHDRPEQLSSSLNALK